MSGDAIGSDYSRYAIFLRSHLYIFPHSSTYNPVLYILHTDNIISDFVLNVGDEVDVLETGEHFFLQD